MWETWKHDMGREIVKQFLPIMTYKAKTYPWMIQEYLAREEGEILTGGEYMYSFPTTEFSEGSEAIETANIIENTEMPETAGNQNGAENSKTAGSQNGAESLKTTGSQYWMENSEIEGNQNDMESLKTAGNQNGAESLKTAEKQNGVENLKTAGKQYGMESTEITGGTAGEESADDTTEGNGRETAHYEKQGLQGPVQEISLEELSSYEKLVDSFYIIDSNTMVGSDQLNAKLLGEMDMTIEKEDAPQILIYHTHSMEDFADSDPENSDTGIMGVGRRLADLLETQYGYKVLHYKERYDVNGRDDAYSKALPDISALLKAYPSIQVVIDLHRDEMPEDTRLVTMVDGKPTAKFMFFNGLSRTKKTGKLDYLKNPYQTENLAFSFQMKRMAEEYYPGLTRKIYLKGYRYNMHLCPKSLLVELGAQNNTLEEALNACEPLAHILDLVLCGEEKTQTE